MAQFMKFIYGILTIFIGSFLFTGILENYKNDAEVRSLLVENYYIPARNSMTQCLSKHSDYINAYSDYLGTQELMYQELKRMKEDSKLVNNFDYALWMKTLLEKHSENNKKYIKLQNEVEPCYIDALTKLELLSIVTGLYENYHESLSIESNKFNDKQKELSTKYTNIIGDFKTQDIVKIFNKFIESNFKSHEAMNELLKTQDMLNNSKPLWFEREQEKFKFYEKIFLNSNNQTALKINNMYKVNFVDWIKQIL